MASETMGESRLAYLIVYAILIALPEIIKALGGVPLEMPDGKTLDEIAAWVKADLGHNPRFVALLKEMAAGQAEETGVPDLEKC